MNTLKAHSPDSRVRHPRRTHRVRHPRRLSPSSRRGPLPSPPSPRIASRLATSTATSASRPHDPVQDGRRARHRGDQRGGRGARPAARARVARRRGQARRGGEDRRGAGLEDRVALISGPSSPTSGSPHLLRRGEEGSYVAAEPLADALVWSKGNRYTSGSGLRRTCRRPCSRARRRRTGEALGHHRAQLRLREGRGRRVQEGADRHAARRRVRGRAVAGPVQDRRGRGVQALAAAEPEAIYNVPFGGDLAKFAREGKLRGLSRAVWWWPSHRRARISRPAQGEAPEGWLVTGYPWTTSTLPSTMRSFAAYQAKYDDYPRIGSIVGYNTMLTIQALIEKAAARTPRRWWTRSRG